jgi:hypothetical protein
MAILEIACADVTIYPCAEAQQIMAMKVVLQIVVLMGT